MLTSFRPRMALGVLVLTGGIALLAPGCSSDGDGGSTSSTPFGGKKVESTIGPSGGTLTSADGNVVVVIPAGALAADTALFVEPASGVPSGALAAVELGPTGTAFALPAQITISFASLELDKIDLGKFRLGTVVSGVWQAVPGSSVDTAARKVPRARWVSPGAASAPAMASSSAARAARPPTAARTRRSATAAAATPRPTPVAA